MPIFLELPHKLLASLLVKHYDDVIMGAIASQITSLTIVYSTVYSDADQRKHQSSASLAFVRGIHRGPVNSPHKWPVTQKMLPFDDVIMGRRRTKLTQSFLFLNRHCDPILMHKKTPCIMFNLGFHCFQELCTLKSNV